MKVKIVGGPQDGAYAMLPRHLALTPGYRVQLEGTWYVIELSVLGLNGGPRLVPEQA